MAVVLHTTVGDLPVLLHYQTCPLASFNFLALCASGYYDGCTFYRHFPGILLQTGDPTNTGKGGESIFAQLPFVANTADGDEGGDAVSSEAASVAAAGILPGRYFHDEGFGVTTHAQRGTLSMAHKGTRADTNASQFFITTSPQSSFDGFYTAFGVVDLNGVYSASEAAVVAEVASCPEGEVAGSSLATAEPDAVGGAAPRCGDAVLTALEVASAKVDEKNVVQLASRARITNVTVLYNPFAEGKMKL
ncbi:putative cyclophilin 7 [Leishmania infantum JPCM5]|uniref:Cyclophilin_7_-_putative n=2 Tax=Leishmania infantum TaxID=5671 RepID=A0A6L0XQZ0_LEIIN|nr:putative cyclophilin 7 [Leishmania infantum JPCM5]CAC9546103.1 cyclophilin_7_-_putative [Leishmania infantum]CAM72271.1 putative cyclophilin 7 [Leishmania infantum JPCM5]SUZ46190.1 cyclophilin_7_-_putative [Leishmania infantum]|eukprot:XP_001469169.1 putative cyclophilin 7 [Leishmania infantum JPCM5]